MDIIRKPQIAQPDTSNVRTMQINKTPSKRWVVIVFGIVLAFIIAVLLWCMVAPMLVAQRIDSKKYQIVYLNNGQMYFGKLQNVDGAYLYMTSPYTTQATSSHESADDQTQTTIIKVSNQLYGPEDSIAIRASEVSFWQNLRDDSKVSQAIKAKTQ